MLVYSINNLKGQEKTVAGALLKHGFIDKEYALAIQGIRNLHDVIMRLRRKGWNILTNKKYTSRLYTLRRNIEKESDILVTAIETSIENGQLKRALKQSELLTQLLKSQV